jgi:uncharacterized protein YkwD
MPVSQGAVWNIVNTDTNLSTRIQKDAKAVEKNIIKSINTLRAGNNTSLLDLDTKLSELAQKKAENMAHHDYV